MNLINHLNVLRMSSLLIILANKVIDPNYFTLLMVVSVAWIPRIHTIYIETASFQAVAQGARLRTSILQISSIIVDVLRVQWFSIFQLIHGLRSTRLTH
jgi:hypothetical protein